MPSRAQGGGHGRNHAQWPQDMYLSSVGQSGYQPPREKYYNDGPPPPTTFKPPPEHMDMPQQQYDNRHSSNVTSIPRPRFTRTPAPDTYDDIMENAGFTDDEEEFGDPYHKSHNLMTMEHRHGEYTSFASGQQLGGPHKGDYAETDAYGGDINNKLVWSGSGQNTPDLYNGRHIKRDNNQSREKQSRRQSRSRDRKRPDKNNRHQKYSSGFDNTTEVFIPLPNILPKKTHRPARTSEFYSERYRHKQQQRTCLKIGVAVSILVLTGAGLGVYFGIVKPILDKNNSSASEQQSGTGTSNTPGILTSTSILTMPTDKETTFLSPSTTIIPITTSSTTPVSNAATTSSPATVATSNIAAATSNNTAITVITTTASAAAAATSNIDVTTTTSNIDVTTPTTSNIDATTFNIDATTSNIDATTTTASSIDASTTLSSATAIVTAASSSTSSSVTTSSASATTASSIAAITTLTTTMLTFSSIAATTTATVASSNIGSDIITSATTQIIATAPMETVLATDTIPSIDATEATFSITSMTLSSDTVSDIMTSTSITPTIDIGSTATTPIVTETSQDENPETTMIPLASQAEAPVDSFATVTDIATSS